MKKNLTIKIKLYNEKLYEYEIIKLYFTTLNIFLNKSIKKNYIIVSSIKHL